MRRQDETTKAISRVSEKVRSTDDLKREKRNGIGTGRDYCNSFKSFGSAYHVAMRGRGVFQIVI